jgi:hypothetical protein
MVKFSRELIVGYKNNDTVDFPLKDPHYITGNVIDE